MKLTSAHCRAQETYHRDRAACATLDNIRIVAQRAAKAWEREALLAERFEAGRNRQLVIAEISSVERSRVHDEDEWSSSENPDRGRADD